MKEHTQGYLFILGAIVLWSTVEVVSKAIHGDIQPLTIGFIRFSLASLLLLPCGIYKIHRNKNWKMLSNDIYPILLAAFLGITLTFTLFHTALYTVKASTAATIIAAVPLPVLLLSSLLLKESLSRRMIVGVGVGMFGVILLSIEEMRDPGSAIGIMLLLCALMSFSFFTVINKNTGRRLNPVSSTAFSISLGSLMFIPVLLATNTPLLPDVDTVSWLLLLYLGFLATGTGYLLFFTGLNMVETARGSSLFYLKPVLVLLLAIWLLGEPFSFLSVAGIVVVVLSLRIALSH
ncbi:MAG: DMT family transporter [Thermoplasmata archaeon]|nr:DMT family transporter [Thermoplasmata archaeon]